MGQGETEVVIIGAGAAGLACARTLRLAGVPTLLLEARNRLGGRIHTTRDLGPLPLELGAEFVHGAPPASLGIAEAAGLRPLELSPQHLFRGGAPDAGQAIGQLQELLAEHRGPEQPALAALDGWITSGRFPAAGRAAALRYLEGFNAADARRASATALAEQERAAARVQGERLFRFPQGYDRLAHALASALDPDALRPSTVVTEVRWGEREVLVLARTASGRALAPCPARAAVVTVPLGVLQAPPGAEGALRFRPELPEAKRRAIAALQAGPVVKLLLRLRPDFARRALPDLPGQPAPSDLGFVHGSGQAFPTWWSLQPLRAPWLVGWAAGPAAAALAGVEEPELLRRALASLAELLGRPAEEVEQAAEAWRVADWLRDPFARGAYSWVPVGATGAPAALAEPCGALHFAGEAAEATGQAGTVHGAIASGERAAASVLRALGR